MRLILSRKGMDSSFGGFPSAILPDGRLCPFPIPELGPDATLKGIPYSRIRFGDTTLGDLVAQVTRSRIRSDTLAHLDPDLDAAAAHREPGWRPVFGQSGAAESHLSSRGVGPGDLFLFFGWFRQTVVAKATGQLRFARKAPHLHAIYGWLQIGERISLTGGGRPPSWASRHPHCLGSPYAAQDSLYVANEHLELPGIAPGTLPGGGAAGYFSSELQLTAPGKNRSVWHLPEFFHPDVSPLSYHLDLDRWRRNPAPPGQVQLETVGRGQEFVFGLPRLPEAESWIAAIARSLAARP